MPACYSCKRNYRADLLRPRLAKTMGVLARPKPHTELICDDCTKLAIDDRKAGYDTACLCNAYVNAFCEDDAKETA